MARIKLIHIIVVIILAVIVLVAIRLHVAAGQPLGRDTTDYVEQGRLYAMGWCTECHSVERETAGTGKFAPDFTAIARRRSAHWLNVFLRTEHKIMPDFVLKPSESDAIVTYILSLKRG